MLLSRRCKALLSEEPIKTNATMPLSPVHQPYNRDFHQTVKIYQHKPCTMGCHARQKDEERPAYAHAEPNTNVEEIGM